MGNTAVILAAGIGTRMRSPLPKALQLLGGRTMISRVVESCAEVFDRVVVVVGPGMAAVATEVRPHFTALQSVRRGTAHAAMAASHLFGDGEVAVLYADNPLVRPSTLKALLARRALGDGGLAMLAMRPADPARYGRVITGPCGGVTRIVEWADGTEEERATRLCNAGAICAPAADLLRWLQAIAPAGPDGELYLTGVVGLAVAEGVRVVAVEGPEEELRGVNSPEELAEAEASLIGS